MKTFKVSIHFNEIRCPSDDEDRVREAVKDAISEMLSDDEFAFDYEEVEEDF